MERDENSKIPRWRSVGYWTNRKETGRWPGDRSHARDYSREDMHRYNQRAIAQSEEMRRLRGGQYREAPDDDRGPHRDAYQRWTHARPPYREARHPNLTRRRARVEPGHVFQVRQAPWENRVDNYWGRSEMQRHLRRDFDPAERRERRNSVGGRPDVTSGRYYTNNLPTRLSQDWSDGPDYDLDPGYDYEFGTDFDFFNTLDAEDARRRSQCQESDRHREPWDVPGPFQGVGPQGYHPSDERIIENISEALSRSRRIDSSAVRVQVEQGVVTLTGDVSRRDEKYAAEEIASSFAGVDEVDNRIHVREARRG